MPFLYLRYLAYLFGLISIILHICVTHAESQENHVDEQQQQLELPESENLEQDSRNES